MHNKQKQRYLMVITLFPYLPLDILNNENEVVRDIHLFTDMYLIEKGDKNYNFIKETNDNNEQVEIESKGKKEKNLV